MPHSEHIEYSIHGAEERIAAGFGRADVRHGLENGTVIETYPDTGRGDSCLLSARLPNGRPIHIVGADKPAGEVRPARTVIVTVYDPRTEPDTWTDDFSKRRER